jgi:hypothetical protein
MPDTDIQLRAATHDGHDRVSMHIIWKGQRIDASYTGGEYTEVKVGGHIEVIHNDKTDVIRSMWREDTGTKIGMLFVQLEDWCRIQEIENPDWVAAMLEYGQWS